MRLHVTVQSFISMWLLVRMTNYTFIAIASVFGPTLVSSQGNDQLDGRILKGYTAPYHEFPYLAAIWIFNEHNCGGSIIHRFWILTAGHCVFGFPPHSMLVALGTNQITATGLGYRVALPIVHEKFLPEPWLFNDIALLRVDRPIHFGVNVQPIRLASRHLPPGTPCVVSGLGWLNLRQVSPFRVQYLHQRLVDTNLCRTTFLKKSQQILDTNVCAISTVGRGTCHGDSGGPLVCNGTLYGIISQGDPCAKGFPDIYTSVYAYFRWIALKIVSNP